MNNERTRSDDGQPEERAMRDVAAPETAAVLTWMVERAGYQLIRSAGAAVDPRIVEVLTDIVWTTLYQPAGRADAPRGVGG